MKKTILLIVLLSWLTAGAQISPYLQDILNKQPGKSQPVILILKKQWNADSARMAMKADGVTASARIKQTVKSVKAFTQRHQRNLSDKIHKMKADYRISNITAFWAANMIALKASPAAIYALSEHEDLSVIVYDEPGYAIYPGEKKSTPAQRDDEVLQGLIAINAPALWDMGYTGKGRLAFGIDTGVFPDHPAFENRFLGNYFPLSQCWHGHNNSWPFDISDHGTHTMGTTLGMYDNHNDTIGVAFDAYFIASDPIVSNLSELRPRSELMESFQWALNPDENANTTYDVPDAINNSWGLSNSGNPDHCDMPSTLILNTVNTAGIAVIFSAGNDGPQSGTIGEPAHIARSTSNVFSIGAINGTNLTITNFSSRGPTNCYDGPDSSLLIKPEVCAPGSNVYSSTGQDNYDYMSGTSMAAPHVTGAVLLLKEAFPEVPGVEILMALYQTATDLGDEGEDNTYGNGIINVEEAYYYLAEIYTPATPDSVISDPVCKMEQLQYTGPQSAYEVNLVVHNYDSANFTINDLNLSYNGAQLSFDSVVDDQLFKKIITLTINAESLNAAEQSIHSITGNITTDAPGDDTINNRFWFRIYHPNVKTLPYTETFEDANHDFTGSSAFAENPDRFITWRVDTIDGYADNLQAAKMLFIKYKQMEGERDIMHTPPVDIAGADNPNFSFKYCYAKRAFSIFEDSLLIKARYGENFEFSDTLLLMYGESMATMDENYNTFNFVPTSPDQWNDTTISLSDLQSYGAIQIEFIAINDNGNNLHIDNIAVHDGENPLDIPNIDENLSKNRVKIYPNPAKTKIFINHPKSEGVITIINLSGQVVARKKLQHPGTTQMNVSNLTPGIYMIRFTGGDMQCTRKLIRY